MEGINCALMRIRRTNGIDNEWVVSMKKIFIGMLLVFLDFNLDIGSSRIGLIPDFLGYIYMLKGLSELIELSTRFSKVKPYVNGMAIYSGFCYAIDLFGVTSMIGEPINFALGLMATILSLFISHSIILGIKDIEVAKEQNLNSEQLYAAWKMLAVFSFILYLAYVVPALAFVCILASFIIGIFYLFRFNETKNLFYEQNPMV